MTDPTPAEAIQLKAQEKYAAIRGNHTLSQTEMTKQLAAAHVDAKAKLDALQAKGNADTTQRQAALSTKLLGIGSTDPSAAISHRDAQDRVAAISPTDGRAPGTMLANATQSGDTSMEKALLGKALTEGNVDLVNQYLAAHPAAEPDITELWNLQHGPKHSAVMDAFTYAAPKPSELGALDDFKINQLANA